MSNPFVGEIRMFGFNFPPRGWAFCDGQLLSISQNTALFALLGTFYGGNGQTTFALPDLQGRAPVHWGQGQGLTSYSIGEESGVESITLLVTEMPVHSHTPARGASAGADQLAPTGNVWAKGGGRRATVNMYTATSTPALMNPAALSIAGSSLPHNNMQPYLTLNFCIALQGVFPQRP
ncbi:MAG TPA: tail fiber protein [Pyrinomonadaceae bacterium]|nr:tail fiber protein [Pyrinomonadaceae bacterium]